MLRLILHGMTSIVFFTRTLPSCLSAQLDQTGIQIFEALAISEVLHLCETENIDIVVIAADVDDYSAGVIAQHRMTLRLKPEATAKEVTAQLWQMFPDKSAAIQ